MNQKKNNLVVDWYLLTALLCGAFFCFQQAWRKNPGQSFLKWKYHTCLALARNIP